VYQCAGCDTFAVQPRGRTVPPSKGRPDKVTAAQGPPVGESCSHCGNRFKVAGPMWLAPIHDMKFVNRMIERMEQNSSTFAAPDRALAKLKAVSRELVDVPLYYDLSQIANTLHCILPPMGMFV
jgi:tRNA (guanine26-N2/guanine27-N2)-dimethyltransferase